MSGLGRKLVAVFKGPLGVSPALGGRVGTGLAAETAVPSPRGKSEQGVLGPVTVE